MLKAEHKRTPFALTDLAGLLGREEPLYALHGAVLRAAHAVGPVVESGAVLATCSDVAPDWDRALLLSA